MNKLLLAAFAASVVASPAAAAEFNGLYAGGGVLLDNIQGSGAAEGLGINGIGGTVFVGGDVAVGPGFVGLEGNIDINTADENTLDAKAKWGWGLSGRAGLKINDSTGVYGRVGYVRNKVGILGSSGWGDGVRFGAGVETGLTEQVSLRVEFNHANYEQSLINNQLATGILFRF